MKHCKTCTCDLQEGAEEVRHLELNSDCKESLCADAGGLIVSDPKEVTCQSCRSWMTRNLYLR